MSHKLKRINFGGCDFPSKGDSWEDGSQKDAGIVHWAEQVSIQSPSPFPEYSRRASESKGVQSTLQAAKSRTRSRLASWKDSGPPDGGRNAWTQVAMAHLVSFNTWGYANSFGVFQTYYVTEWGYSRSAVSWIGSMQIFFLFFLGAFSGRATDRGYFYHVIIAGTVFELLGIAFTSIASEYWHLVMAQGIFTGIGNGLLLCPILAVTSTYFSKHRSIALGFVACGAATGGLVYPALVQNLLPRIGFAWTLRAMGSVMFVTLTLVILMVGVRIPARIRGGLIDLGAFKEPPFVLFLIGSFPGVLGIYFAYYYIGLYGHDIIGVSEKYSISLLIIVNAVGTVGRLLPNYLADHYGTLNTLIPYTALTGVALFSWVAVRDQGDLTAFSVVYGLFSAGSQSLLATTVASLTSDVQKRGVRLGMVFSTVSFAALAGSPLGGIMIQHAHGKYVEAQIFAAAALIVSFLLLLATRLAKTGLRFEVIT